MHKALQIRDVIVDLAEQIKSAGFVNQVCKGAEPPVSFPAIIVSIGQDTPSLINGNFVDWTLTINTEIEARSVDDDLDAEIQAVREQLHIAMMSQYDIGLSYVTRIEPGSQSEPVRKFESDSYSVSVNITWDVRYRTELSTPSI